MKFLNISKWNISSWISSCNHRVGWPDRGELRNKHVLAISGAGPRASHARPCCGTDLCMGAHTHARARAGALINQFASRTGVTAPIYTPLRFVCSFSRVLVKTLNARQPNSARYVEWNVFQAAYRSVGFTPSWRALRDSLMSPVGAARMDDWVWPMSDGMQSTCRRTCGVWCTLYAWDGFSLTNDNIWPNIL